MQQDERALPTVWAREDRSRREQPALSRAQIVAEALRLLDAEGMEALTMRKLGARLDAGATSLYRHVANKDELVELVVDEVFGEIRTSSGGDWRSAVADVARDMRAAILRHPWVASALGAAGMSYLGPNLLRLSEDLLVTLEAAGFPLLPANIAMNTVFAYVIGVATSEAAWLTMLQRGGQSEQEWTARLRPTIERATRGYPRLAALYEAEGARNPEEVREDDFEVGLRHVLDGLEVARDRDRIT
ncbi:TetR/AcrR family transcriptional regulator [Saccharothrix coeruleofusca]|uniref:TetR/AcrR family transcriptional regulator n=1 Tax=Saccharothrix coeruleofusca TaxID=33919 RepID=UPI00167131D7|nr:TetR/AcrR family transcriptional regulator [Saccharothrix coeruleofusca]MBP2340294.1 AcrR family transcriptional regulator [Saccharothrix coeruleofusca]